MSIEKEFIKKSDSFRSHFGLSEDDVEVLLSKFGLKFKGLSLGSKTLTLELAETYTKIVYGLEYCVFKKKETDFPKFEDLPIDTRNLLNKKPQTGNKVGTKGTKNNASYIIYIIKDFPVGQKLTNSQILPFLPSSSEADTSIHWNKGLLKGLVKNIKKPNSYIDDGGTKRTEATYEIIKAVNQELLEKAMKNIDKDWLKEFEEKLNKE